MQRAELEAEISRLERKLRNCQSKRDASVRELRELELVADKIRQKSAEIENGLQETIGNIESRLARVNSRSRFPIRYRAHARELLLNAKSSQALADTREAELAAKRRCLQLDDDIAGFNAAISSTSAQLEELRRKLSEGGDLL